MKMIIVRHGEAEKDSPTGRDKDRVLTEKGVHDVKKMAEFIKKTPLKVNYIFHSPYKRTEMTAEIFANEFGVTQIQPSDKLLPSEDYGEICNDFNHFSNSDTVLIVGHNPDVSYFCSKLIGTGSCSSSCFPAFAFSPGTSVAMNIAKENFIKGQIIWILSPDYILSEPTNSK